MIVLGNQMSSKINSDGQMIFMIFTWAFNIFLIFFFLMNLFIY